MQNIKIINNKLLQLEKILKSKILYCDINSKFQKLTG